MSLNLNSEEVSIRGVKTSTIASITKKPSAFAYTPSIQQKRIANYDDDGFMNPGIPVPIGKDYRLQVGWNVFNPTVAEWLVTTDVADNLYSASVLFALTDGATKQFTATSLLIIDGSSINLDPLSDSMSVAFILKGPATF